MAEYTLKSVTFTTAKNLVVNFSAGDNSETISFNVDPTKTKDMLTLDSGKTFGIKDILKFSHRPEWTLVENDD